MTPVDQEFIHKPEIGQHGDCQRVVIASLMNLPMSEVPHFLHDGDSSEFWDRIQSFLEKYGYQWVVIHVPPGGIDGIFYDIS